MISSTHTSGHGDEYPIDFYLTRYLRDEPAAMPGMNTPTATAAFSRPDSFAVFFRSLRNLASLLVK
jgi:hypothetical protein